MGIVLNFVKESPTLIILSLLFYVAIYYYRYFIRENPLPGPFPIPALGNILYVIVYKGDYGKLGLDLQKKYGDIFEFYFGSERQIWLGRADLAAKIFKTNHFKRMNFSHGLNEINGHDNGLLNNTNYVTWRRNRKILQSAISTPIFMKSVVIPDVQALFTDLESLWARLGPETEIDLAGWLYRFTCQFIIKACTSQKKDVLREYYYNYLTSDPSISTGEHEDWTELVKHVGTTTEWLFAFPKWLRIYLPGFRQHHESVVKKFYHVCERVENEFVKPARMEMEDIPVNKDAPRDLLSLLCSSETKNPNMSPMTDHEIARVLVEVFLNGSEAVASLVSFMTYFLCLHPKHYKALQHEISEVVGSDLDKPITYEQLNKLVYCEAIFKETARLIPFLPTINRVSSADDEISGMQWPADTMFLVNTCGIHSHPSHWAEPEKFDPSRFLDKDGELDGKSDMYTFLPFGGGARFCPGRFLGMTELKVIMVLLFGKYDVRLVDENSSPNRIYEGGANACEEMKVFIKPKIRYRRKNQKHAVS